MYLANITEAPKIRLPSSPIVMEVGVASQIDCTIERGHPTPTIKWTKKGIQSEVLSNGPSLMFPNPTEMQQAIYSVEVNLQQNIAVEYSFNLVSGRELGGP